MDRRYGRNDQEKRPKEIELQVKPGLKIVLGASLQSSSGRGGAYSISHGSWLGLKFDEDQLVHKVRELDCTAIILFLTLLIGSPVALDDFYFLPKGKSGEMVDEHRVLEPRGYFKEAKDERDVFFMRASYPRIADKIEGMLGRWFALFENPDMRAVLDLYAAVMFSELYDTAYFLFLAQALEAYHTACRKFSGNVMPPTEFKKMLKRVGKAITVEDYAVLRDRIAGANQKTFAMRLHEVISVAPTQI